MRQARVGPSMVLHHSVSFTSGYLPQAGAPVTGYQVDYALQPARGRERDAPWQTAYEGPEQSCQVQLVHLCQQHMSVDHPQSLNPDTYSM